MPPHRSALVPLAMAVLLPALVPTAASATAALASHRAVYDLSLAARSDELRSAEGRIVMELRNACGDYDLTYRFVARFFEEQEVTLTDQRTTSKERVSGDRFEFETSTLVDGIPQSEVKGTAQNSASATSVKLEKPAEREFELPLSVFPMNHTADLIETAEAGGKVVQVSIFDGDQDAQKKLTSTAIILPAPVATTSDEEDGAKTPKREKVLASLAGLKSWYVDESYYSSESNADGMPIFHSTYRLYQNGVSDDIVLDYGSYALKGSLSRLDYLQPKPCR
ncbi:EipB family protein [Consotaella salsifontis]|uniref:DUF1849 family protein n=1 Tax=Consotaella salsifontis TaxID=1365950 RepID=A0A1T4T023_9HYPH|nr:DUF1849 family protein [Consotaella salsifontis]SKA33591.1 protein of unknown function [Consotaella salsifontis]